MPHGLKNIDSGAIDIRSRSRPNICDLHLYKHSLKHHSTPPWQHYFLASYLPTKPISTAEAVRVTMVVTTFTFGSKVGIGLSVGVTGGGTMHY